MNSKTLYALWGGLFVLCAGLGFIPEPAGFLKFLLGVLGLVFFIPPMLLLLEAGHTGNRDRVALIRNLSIVWLAATAGLLAANFLSLAGTPALGDVLYTLLTIATAPMICGQVWVLTMFCWAFLLFTCIHMLRHMKK